MDAFALSLMSLLEVVSQSLTTWNIRLVLIIIAFVAYLYGALEKLAKSLLEVVCMTKSSRLVYLLTKPNSFNAEFSFQNVCNSLIPLFFGGWNGCETIVFDNTR